MAQVVPADHRLTPAVTKQESADTHGKVLALDSARKGKAAERKPEPAIEVLNLFYM